MNKESSQPKEDKMNLLSHQSQIKEDKDSLKTNTQARLDFTKTPSKLKQTFNENNRSFQVQIGDSIILNQKKYSKLINTQRKKHNGSSGSYESKNKFQEKQDYQIQSINYNIKSKHQSKRSLSQNDYIQLRYQKKLLNSNVTVKNMEKKIETKDQNLQTCIVSNSSSNDKNYDYINLSSKKLISNVIESAIQSKKSYQQQSTKGYFIRKNYKIQLMNNPILSRKQSNYLSQQNSIFLNSKGKKNFNMNDSYLYLKTHQKHRSCLIKNKRSRTRKNKVRISISQQQRQKINKFLEKKSKEIHQKQVKITKKPNKARLIRNSRRATSQINSKQRQNSRSFEKGKSSTKKYSQILNKSKISNQMSFELTKNKSFDNKVENISLQRKSIIEQLVNIQRELNRLKESGNKSVNFEQCMKGFNLKLERIIAIIEKNKFNSHSSERKALHLVQAIMAELQTEIKEYTKNNNSKLEIMSKKNQEGIRVHHHHHHHHYHQHNYYEEGKDAMKVRSQYDGKKLGDFNPFLFKQYEKSLGLKQDKVQKKESLFSKLSSQLEQELKDYDQSLYSKSKKLRYNVKKPNYNTSSDFYNTNSTREFLKGKQPGTQKRSFKYINQRDFYRDRMRRKKI